MAYKNNGTVHWNGVAGEHEMTSFLNDYVINKNYQPIFMDFFAKEYKIISVNANEMEFIQEGGTQKIEDIYEKYNKIKISIKTKELKNQKPNGTFDLINTSQLSSLADRSNTSFYDVLKTMEKYKINIRKEYSTKPSIFTNVKIENIRKEVTQQCNSLLKTIDGDTINSLLLKIIDHEANITIIRFKEKNSQNNVDKNQVYFLKKDWIKEIMKDINLKQNYISNKTSAFIKNKDGSNGILRIRVVYNNGVSSLIGIGGRTSSGKNKNTISTLTLKIQVDKVQDVIDRFGIQFKNLEKFKKLKKDLKK